MTVFKSSKKLFRRSPGLPTNVIAIPNNTANTMICNIFPSAIALNGLRGMISMRTCQKEGATPGSKSTSAERFIPAPGRTISAAAIARARASAVVTRYKHIDFPPKRPSLAGSLSALVPNTSDTNTNGTTSIIKLAMNTSPITANSPLMRTLCTQGCSAIVSCNMIPSAIPESMPITTLLVRLSFLSAIRDPAK